MADGDLRLPDGDVLFEASARWAVRECSFCGGMFPSERCVLGSSPRVAICADCVELARRSLVKSPAPEPSPACPGCDASLDEPPPVHRACAAALVHLLGGARSRIERVCGLALSDRFTEKRRREMAVFADASVDTMIDLAYAYLSVGEIDDAVILYFAALDRAPDRAFPKVVKELFLRRQRAFDLARALGRR